MSKKRVIKVYQTQQIPTQKPDNRVLYVALGGMLFLVLILLGIFFRQLFWEGESDMAVDAPYESAPISLSDEDSKPA